MSINWDVYDEYNPKDKLVGFDSSKYIFIKSELIETIFPLLIDSDKKLLLLWIVRLINFICVKFSLTDKKDLFWNQLVQNDLLDLRSLLGSMLPFINDDPLDNNKHSLKKLEDLYLEMDPDGMKYKYTNMQYNRCIRTDNNDDYSSGITKRSFDIIKRPFKREYFENHMRLLLMSVETVANKLYVNWTNVIPITMENFKKKKIYEKTVEKLGLDQAVMIDYYIDREGGLSFQDMYNVITNHLYHEIKDYKWLIFEILIGNQSAKDGGGTETVVTHLEKIFNLDLFWKEKSWSQLSDNEQGQFKVNWTSLMTSKEKIKNYISYYIHRYFCRSHINVDRLERDGKLVCKIEQLGDIDAKNLTANDIETAISGILNVPVDEIYLFLLNQLAGFKRSWYYYMLKIKKMGACRKDPYWVSAHHGATYAFR